MTPRRAFDENADSLNLPAACLGVSPATIAARPFEHAVIAAVFTSAARAAPARIDRVRPAR
ncbi:hypothetical protein ACIP98_36520 [Streptomyces sp. NPDC088354]|uniref:hypothetical protein n=1 Tax=unclassified Streptomyces TaxID=2593676 RepID=UPI0029A07FDC|nr:hypothetical protein [Streptomyces sp. MI02-7b]MDX3076238.1 hypothetical protein [Streptomyces sp. MI02-7b]